MAISREEQLKILGQMKDSDIDYSDAEPTNAEFWKDAVVHIPPKKVKVSIRLDQDVIAWYKRQTTRGYQTFINAVLRDYMQKYESNTQK
ncbi:BrnA antitoxin family protein [Pleurocapsales cyanobacterium LEGE 06147]|nr:BrnA antitoxin family protein [Pleurocapsales cyanobacterium LEGE 06147]